MYRRRSINTTSTPPPSNATKPATIASAASEGSTRLRTPSTPANAPQLAHAGSHATTADQPEQATGTAEPTRRSPRHLEPSPVHSPGPARTHVQFVPSGLPAEPRHNTGPATEQTEPHGGEAARGRSADRPLLVYTEDHEPNGPDAIENAGTTQQGPTAFSRFKWALQDQARKLLPTERQLNKCYRVTYSDDVQIHRSPSRNTAAYRGLCTCNSVWQCPVCSSRIAATRAAEITTAIETHLANGGTVLLATFTASHTRDDTLHDLHGRHTLSHARFWRQRCVREALDRVGYIGRITGQEVTFGNQSGWHPHRHALLFIDANADTERLQHTLKLAWYRTLLRAFDKVNMHIGLDLRGGESAGAYVSKLGLEVALACRKKGRSSDRFGPWQLLHESSTGTTWAAHRFIEYTRMMKNARHLVWSDGLKARLGVVDITDDQIMANKGIRDEALYATLSKNLWHQVRKAGIRDDLLQLIGLDDTAELRQLLTETGIDPHRITLHTDDLSI